MPRWRVLLPVVLALLGSAVLSGRALECARKDAGIVPSAARVPLGGFEPLVVDILHLRGEMYLRSRRLPEAVASIRLATELQPRIPEYWVELGSLLAWEYAHTTADPKTRWRWAREGIRVLERGLVHNPNSPRILFALGFLYLHRVSMNSEIADLAARDLGTWPAALARRTFKRHMEVEPNVFALGEFGQSSRILGDRLRAVGERSRALEFYREAQAVFRKRAEDPDAEGARDSLREIEAVIAGLEAGQEAEKDR